MESKLIPDTADLAIPCRSAIVFALQAGDEVFGCGGTLALHVAAGHQVAVVVISDGASSLEAERAACVGRRQAESRAAAAVLGYPEPSFWYLPERDVDYGEILVERIAKEIRERQADLVYAPTLHEAEPDHHALAMASAEAVRRIGAKLRLAYYEIGVPLRPTIFADITAVQALKRRAMRCFASPLDHQRYDKQIDALNRYRTCTLPPAVMAAEAFELVSAAEISRNHLALLDAEYQHMRELRQQHHELQRHSEWQQQQIQLQQAEIQKLSHIRTQHLQTLDAIHRSTSWRITRPLRGARRMAAALRRHLRLRLITNVLKAVRSEISRHGATGFARRVPYYLKNSRTYLALLGSGPPASDDNAFSATAYALREIRLHPDLEGGGATIDAKVSVVIPTLNAGLEFNWMLRKLRSQCGVREIEIVIVDSGSRDQTVQAAREAGAKVIEILPTEFSHSYARNLGADAATGDYVLFMVQDAYPIGDYWLYGMLRYLLNHADEKLVAVSCAEFSRSDSDMMYDSMINTHYRFLGCLEFDRIGEFRGDAHMALRSQGQLSDVSCLISRERFSQYRYRGNYAEDLDLGIRLIKDGYRVAMLSSVKVVHSHNRPAYYYLKRSFVDVIFLVGLFDDFPYPHCESLPGLLAGVRSTAAYISAWLEDPEASAPAKVLAEYLDDWISLARKDVPGLSGGPVEQLGDDSLEEFVNKAQDRYLGAGDVLPNSTSRNEAMRFANSFLARLEHFNRFAGEVYGRQDALLRKELADVVCKTFAATVGSALAFYYLDHPAEDDAEHVTAQAMYQELVAGI